MPAKKTSPKPRRNQNRNYKEMESRREKAFELLAKGLSQSEVSRQLDVTRQAVSLWVLAKRDGKSKPAAKAAKAAKPAKAPKAVKAAKAPKAVKAAKPAKAAKAAKPAKAVKAKAAKPAKAARR